MVNKTETKRLRSAMRRREATSRDRMLRGSVLVARLRLVLNRLNEVALGAYALTTVELWKDLFAGTLSLPGGFHLFGASLLLVAFWAAHVYLEGKLKALEAQ